MNRFFTGKSSIFVIFKILFFILILNLTVLNKMQFTQNSPDYVLSASNKRLMKLDEINEELKNYSKTDRMSNSSQDEINSYRFSDEKGYNNLAKGKKVGYTTKNMSNNRIINESITIINDMNFSLTANIKGWFGTGTEWDPIIIENYNFSISVPAPYIVTINNTSLHFIIRNCLLPGSMHKILLNNVSNARIIRNKLVGATINRYGVFLDNQCTNNSIRHNIFANNATLGINAYCDNAIRNYFRYNWWDDLGSFSDSDNDGLANSQYLLIAGSSGLSDPSPRIYQNHCNNQMITVYSDSQLTSLTKEMGFLGNGSSDNPYIISDINFTLPDEGDPDSLVFSGTSLHLRIENCIVQGDPLNMFLDGIYLAASNITIKNSSVKTFLNGLVIFNGMNNLFLFNDVSNIDGTSILLESGSITNLIKNNTISNVQTGFRCESINSSFIGNVLTNVSDNGLELHVNKCKIFDNKIMNCSLNGIFGNGSHCDIRRNFIENCTLSGFYSNNSQNNSLIENWFMNNSIAILLDLNVRFFYIFENHFLNNDITDNGLNNSWNNSIHGNYWSSYNDFDRNNDNVGDSPLSLPGTAGSIDYFPLGIFRLWILSVQIINPENRTYYQNPTIIIEHQNVTVIHKCWFRTLNSSTWSKNQTLSYNGSNWLVNQSWGIGTNYLEVFINDTDGYENKSEIWFSMGIQISFLNDIVNNTIFTTFPINISVRTNFPDLLLFYSLHNSREMLFNEIPSQLFHYMENGFYEIKIIASDYVAEVNSSIVLFFSVNARKAIQTSIIYPNGGEVLIGSVDIIWVVNDTSHPWSYEITLSGDGGNTWEVLFSDIKQNASWDTTKVRDGNNYLLSISILESNVICNNDISDQAFIIRNNAIMNTFFLLFLFGLAIFMITIISVYVFSPFQEKHSARTERSSLKKEIISSKPRFSKKEQLFRSTFSSHSTTKLYSIDKKTIYQVSKRQSTDKMELLSQAAIPFLWIASQILFPPFLRKLNEKKVLENPFRQKILDILRKREFENLLVLKKELNCGTSILYWHLQVLEDFGLIKSHNIGKYKVFHLKNTVLDQKKLLLYCSFRSRNSMMILQHLSHKKVKSLSIKEMQKATSIDRRTIRFYFSKLIKIDLIDYNQNTKVYYVNNSQKIYFLWLIDRYNGDY